MCLSMEISKITRISWPASSMIHLFPQCSHANHWQITYIASIPLSNLSYNYIMQDPMPERSASKRLWSKEQDDLLSLVVSRHSEPKWSTISSQFNQEIALRQSTVKRTNKQCRQRWQNHLNPILRNSAEWSQAEHEMLFTLFREYSHQWCQISTKLEEGGFARRGDNHIKNYFYSSIKRAIKRINEVVRENNKEIKRQKSIFYNYNEKYAYKKRLSLERQIMNTSLANNDSTSHQNNPPLGLEQRPASHGSMRIIKELDQDIVSKVLLIAQQKGGKKFTISNKVYEEEAISTRNKLIAYIQNSQGFKAQDVIQMTTEILELSRKCKRKNCKVEVEQNEEHEENEASEEDVKEEAASSSLQPSQRAQRLAKIKQIREEKYESLHEKAPKNSGPNLRGNELAEKNLLQRFLCEEEDRNFGETGKKVGSEYSSNKMNEEQPNSTNGLFFNLQHPKICLDQSNSYFYGSNCYSQKGNLPFGFDVVNFPNNFEQRPAPNPYNSLAYDAYESQNFRALASPFDLFRSDNIRVEKVKETQEAQSNFAELNFINTIKQVQPKQSIINSQMFDFDLNPAGFNPFINGFLKKESQQDRLFCSQIASLKRPSSHRSNHSQSRVDRNQANVQYNQVQMDGLICSQQLMNRSWAYSSSRLQQCRNLFNSNNYEAGKKNDFTIDLRNSNFMPFQSKQQ